MPHEIKKISKFQKGIIRVGCIELSQFGTKLPIWAWMIFFWKPTVTCLPIVPHYVRYCISKNSTSWDIRLHNLHGPNWVRIANLLQKGSYEKLTDTFFSLLCRIMLQNFKKILRVDHDIRCTILGQTGPKLSQKGFFGGNWTMLLPFNLEQIMGYNLACFGPNWAQINFKGFSGKIGSCFFHLPNVPYYPTIFQWNS